MTFSLYDAIIPSYQQVLQAVARLVDQAEAFCDERGTAHAEIIDARLAPDMLPFTYQVKSTIVHSTGAIDGVRAGSFSPDMTKPPENFAGLKAATQAALDALAAIERTEVDGFVGRDMAFVMGENRMEFDAEHFLLSFSVPNFYFHATTAYDLLRMKGLPLGKRDFLGRPRLRA